MQFRILGPFEVSDDEGPVPVRGSRQRALLLLLVVNANTVVFDGRMLEALWPEEPPASGRSALRMQIARLRKAIPDGLIVTQRPGYALRITPEAIDAGRFERLRAAAWPRLARSGDVCRRVGIRQRARA